MRLSASDSSPNNQPGAVPRAGYGSARDRPGGCAQFGYETRDIVTFEICKPKGAVDILNEDKFTRMVPFMPMRVAVYKKTDGKIYISGLKLKMMQKCSSGVVKDVMKAGAIDLEKAIGELIQ